MADATPLTNGNGSGHASAEVKFPTGPGGPVIVGAPARNTHTGNSRLRVRWPEWMTILGDALLFLAVAAAVSFFVFASVTRYLLVNGMPDLVSSRFALQYCRGAWTLLYVYVSAQCLLMNWRASIVTNDVRFLGVGTALIVVFTVVPPTVTSNAPIVRDGLISTDLADFSCDLNPFAYIPAWTLGAINTVACAWYVHMHIPGGIMGTAARTMRFFVVNNVTTALTFALQFVLNELGVLDALLVALLMLAIDFSVYLCALGVVIRNKNKRTV